MTSSLDEILRAIQEQQTTAPSASLPEDPAPSLNEVTLLKDFFAPTAADIVDVLTKGASFGILQGSNLPILGALVKEYATPDEQKSALRKYAEFGLIELPVSMMSPLAIPFRAGATLATRGISAIPGVGRWLGPASRGALTAGLEGEAITGAHLGVQALQGEEIDPTHAAIQLAIGGGAASLMGGAASRFLSRGRLGQEEGIADVVTPHAPIKAQRPRRLTPIQDVAKEFNQNIMDVERTAAEIRLLQDAGQPVPSFLRQQLDDLRQAIAAPMREKLPGPLPEHAIADATLEDAMQAAQRFSLKGMKEEMARLFLPNAVKAQEMIASSRDRMGKIAGGLLGGKRITKALKELDDTELRTAAIVIKGQGPGLPGPGQDVGLQVRSQIDALSKLAAAEDLVPEEVIEAHMGEYLRRNYFRNVLGKDWLPAKETFAKARSYLSGQMKIPIGEGQFRAPTGEEVETRMYDILHKGVNELYVGGAKPVRIDLSATKRRKDIPEPIRELMGEIADVRYAAGRTYADLSAMIGNAQFFKRIARGAEPDGTPWFRGNEWAPGYERLPDVPTLGAVRGQFALEKYWHDLNDMTATMTDVDKFFSNVYSQWKANKTVRNPATHIRNTLGNIIFADLADINIFNPKNWPHYKESASAIKEGLFQKKANPLYDEAIASSAIGSEYLGSELSGLANRLAAGEKPWHTLIDRLSTPDKKVGELYTAEDQIFKLAAFAKQRAQGKSISEASAHVNTWFPNYDEVGKAIKYLRESPVGAPFISFSAEATRIYGNALKEHPIKLFNWLVTYPAAITGFSLGYHGLTVDDWDDLRSNLPEYLRSAYLVLLPWRDEEGSVRATDLSYILPNAEMFRSADTPGLVGPIANFALSHPLVSTVAQIMLNRKRFGDQEIFGPLDSKVQKSAEFIWQQAMPSWIPEIPGLVKGGGHYEAIKAAVQGKPSQYGIVRPVEEEIMSRLGAVNSIPMEAPEIIRRTQKATKAEKRDIHEALSRILRDPDRELDEKIAAAQTAGERLSDLPKRPGFLPSDLLLRPMQRMGQGQATELDADIDRLLGSLP